MNSNKSSKWAISYFVEIIGGGTPKTSISDYWNGSIPHLLGHVKIDTTMHYAMVNQANVKNSHRKFIG
ncbi:hypothetical protein FEZ44_12660 [Lactococcus cremoris]|nr:hypothetical protein FEZ44_12660 [Lactococcus cremoris]